MSRRIDEAQAPNIPSSRRVSSAPLPSHQLSIFRAFDVSSVISPRRKQHAKQPFVVTESRCGSFSNCPKLSPSFVYFGNLTGVCVQESASRLAPVSSARQEVSLAVFVQPCVLGLMRKQLGSSITRVSVRHCSLWPYSLSYRAFLFLCLILALLINSQLDFQRFIYSAVI
jgi:hypothetical protein